MQPQRRHCCRVLRPPNLAACCMPTCLVCLPLPPLVPSPPPRLPPPLASPIGLLHHAMLLAQQARQQERSAWNSLTSDPSVRAPKIQSCHVPHAVQALRTEPMPLAVRAAPAVQPMAAVQAAPAVQLMAAVQLLTAARLMASRTNNRSASSA